ncbi:MAG: helix-turn-helix transcriptional regulator [Malacoplasma sp.]
MKTKEWLKKQRLIRLITQDQLAKKLGISKYTIENIEQGRRLGSPETWELIENYFKNKENIISNDSNDIIKEIKEDIEEYGLEYEINLIYIVKKGTIIFTDYQFLKEDELENDYLEENLKQFDINNDTEKNEKYINTTLKYALEVFEYQNRII